MLHSAAFIDAVTGKFNCSLVSRYERSNSSAEPIGVGMSFSIVGLGHCEALNLGRISFEFGNSLGERRCPVLFF